MMLFNGPPDLAGGREEFITAWSWPPRPVPVSSFFVSSALPRSDGDWWQDLEKGDAGRRADADRAAAYYEGKKCVGEAMP
jgi:hypothetical protein